MIFNFGSKDVSKRSEGLETKSHALHLDLLYEHMNDELKGFSKRENFSFRHEFVFLNGFHIEDVIDKAEH